MAKTIKFSLIIDTVAVRDIDGLQDNFCIDDLLQLYRNGLLLKWLGVRGYDEMARQVREIDEVEDLTITQQLVSILGMEQDEDKIREAVSNLRFRQEWLMQLDDYKKAEFQSEMIISDYHTGYDSLIEEIEAKKEDMAFVKSAINEIYTRYIGLFRLNARHFYTQFKDAVPRATLAVLMHNQLRQIFLQDNTINNALFTATSYKGPLIENLIESGEVKVFSGVTAGYWKDIESNDKDYMILCIEESNYVRPMGAVGMELSATDMNGKYLILKGIDYKSNNANHKLLYMEV